MNPKTVLRPVLRNRTERGRIAERGNEKTLENQRFPGLLKRQNAPARTRTLDPLIKSQLLYRLSYKGRTK